MTTEIILIIASGLFSGTGIAALITAFAKKRQWERERQAKKEDKAADEDKNWRTEVDQKLTAQGEGIKFLMYDRIKHLGQEYVFRNAISFDDRKDLHKAYDIYHKGLKEDGDLDALMKEVDGLPLTAGARGIV